MAGEAPTTGPAKGPDELTQALERLAELMMNMTDLEDAIATGQQELLRMNAEQLKAFRENLRLQSTLSKKPSVQKRNAQLDSQAALYQRHPGMAKLLGKTQTMAAFSRLNGAEKANVTTQMGIKGAGGAMKAAGGAMEGMGGIMGKAGGAMAGIGAGMGAAAGPIGMAIEAGIGILKKIFELLAQSSPVLQSSIKLLQKSLMLFLRPIGDMLGLFLRPIAKFFLTAQRKARQVAKAKGYKAGSEEYVKAFYGSMFGSIVEELVNQLPNAIIFLLEHSAPVLMIKQTIWWVKVLLEGIKGVLDWILEGIDKLKDAIIGPIKDMAGGVSDFASKVGNVFGFAEGGMATGPTLGVFGEKETEFLVPKSKATAFASNVLGGKGGRGDIYLTLNIYGAATDDGIKRIVKQGINEAAAQLRRC